MIKVNITMTITRSSSAQTIVSTLMEVAVVAAVMAVATWRHNIQTIPS